MLAGAAAPFLRGQGERFRPTWESLGGHGVPEWFQNAKLGIFIHWGLYSVPAWATPVGELGKVDPKRWFYENPYAEWYLNTLRLTTSPTYKHHVETYGKEFDYYQFAAAFAEKTRAWDPASWAKLFRSTGARYVVLTTKHHDGFTLWPSAVSNPHAGGRTLQSRRDLVGDLTAAVRAAGLKMGLYYSGGLDWTFSAQPISNTQELHAQVPQTEEYGRYVDAHWNELVQRYQPSVLWNDISYPKTGHVPELFASYYNRVADGVANNRFGVEFSDFTTPEYSNYAEITEKKWESCRGLGYSFGYNQVEGPKQVIAPDQLVALLVDIVSKNGNLLLNIGPRADGSISQIQLDRLRKLGEWLAVGGEGIFDSRPWLRPSATHADGTDVRFTRKGDILYVFYLKRPAGRSLRVPGVQAAVGTRIGLLGSTARCSLEQQGPDLMVEVEGAIPESCVPGIRLIPVPG